MVLMVSFLGGTKFRVKKGCWGRLKQLGNTVQCVLFEIKKSDLSYKLCVWVLLIEHILENCGKLKIKVDHAHSVLSTTTYNV